LQSVDVVMLDAQQPLPEHAVVLAETWPGVWPLHWRAHVRCLPGLAASAPLRAWAQGYAGRDQLLAAALRARWEAEPWRWRFLLHAAQAGELVLLATGCPVQLAVSQALADLLNETLSRQAERERRASPVCYADIVETA